MSNNDEFVYYSRSKQTEVDLRSIRTSSLTAPRLVISREVRPEECLSIDFRGRPTEETGVTEITKLLDALEKVQSRMRRESEIHGKPIHPERFLVRWISSAYYDCLSGGMPTWEVVLFRYLCKSPAIDLSTKVYPGKGEGDDWYTLGDWISATEGAPLLEDFFAKYRMALPDPTRMLERW